MKFRFVTLEARHIPTLAQWFRELHVKEFWQETEDLGLLREKFLNLPKSRGVSPYIVQLDGADIGYIQSYEACKVGGGWWPEAKPGLFGIDQFIGIPSMISRGFGTAFIRQFTSELFRDAGAEEIITDPEPGNARAIRAYEKAGFKAVGKISTPGGPALLMKMSKPSS